MSADALEKSRGSDDGIGHFGLRLQSLFEFQFRLLQLEKGLSTAKCRQQHEVPGIDRATGIQKVERGSIIDGVDFRFYARGGGQTRHENIDRGRPRWLGGNMEMFPGSDLLENSLHFLFLCYVAFHHRRGAARDSVRGKAEGLPVVPPSLCRAQNSRGIPYQSHGAISSRQAFANDGPADVAGGSRDDGRFLLGACASIRVVDGREGVVDEIRFRRRRPCDARNSLDFRMSGTSRPTGNAKHRRRERKSK